MAFAADFAGTSGNTTTVRSGEGTAAILSREQQDSLVKATRGTDFSPSDLIPDPSGGFSAEGITSGGSNALGFKPTGGDGASITSTGGGGGGGSGGGGGQATVPTPDMPDMPDMANLPGGSLVVGLIALAVGYIALSGM